MTQNELTLALDKGYNYINGIEQGKSFPQIDVIEQIAKILEIKPAALFDENSCNINVIKTDKSKVAEEITEKFELKKMINTYAIGELLDVDGLCGGYNIHFAIASGVMVANSIYEKEMGKNEKEK